jgi:hypothetical protein
MSPCSKPQTSGLDTPLPAFVAQQTVEFVTFARSDLHIFPLAIEKPGTKLPDENSQNLSGQHRGLAGSATGADASKISNVFKKTDRFGPERKHRILRSTLGTTGPDSSRRHLPER